MYDSATGLTTRYSYDFTGRTGATELHGANGLELWVSEQYDAHNRPTSQTRQFKSTRYTDAYAYNTDGTLQSLALGNLRTITYEYDGLKRITAMNTGTAGNTGPNGRTFTYVPVDDPNFAGNTTGQIKKIQYDELMAKRNYPSFDFDYEYDDNGNISKYTSPVETIEYTYDTQNQLLRADNKGSGTDFSYTYDDAGNILSATKGSTTYRYEYTNADWGDLLTKYNGTAIGYDEIGNPTSYYNGWNFTWKQGREMATATKGSQSLSFTYDADGVRRTKTVNGVIHAYYYVGGKLARETYGSNVLDFFYDQNGHPFMLVYNGTVYYYITNAQGDVIRLTDVKGQTAARYQYDPYGNIIDSAGSHVDINPLRYRGYYFDSETSLYYLLSRYYDPNIGRFINADAFASTGQTLVSNNMFSYCLNDPISLVDSTGNFPWPVVIVVGVGIILGGALGYASEENIADRILGQNIEPPNVNPQLPPPPQTQPSNSRLMPPYRVDPLPIDPEYTPPSNSTTPAPLPSPPTPRLDNSLTTGERISNTILGMGLGAMVGGGVVLLIGAGACIGGAATTVVPLLGMTGKQAVAWGILSYDIFPIFMAPFMGEEMEPLEFPS